MEGALLSPTTGDLTVPDLLRCRLEPRLLHSEFLPVLWWEAGGRITRANDAFLKLLGYTREEFTSGGIRWNEITPPEYAADDLERLQDLLVQGITRPQVKEYIRKDGQRIPVLIMGGRVPEKEEGFAICTLASAAPNPGKSAMGWFETAELHPQKPGSESGDSEDFLPPNFLHKAAVTCALCVAGISGLALAGWMTHVLALASFNSAYIPMAPLTALMFLGLGFSLLLTRWSPPDSLVEKGRVVLSGAAAGLAALVLLDLGLGRALDIERFLVSELRQFDAVPVGRMSPLTAAGFLAMAAAHLCLRSRRPWQRHIAGDAALLGMLISALVVLGYCYGAPLLYGGTIIPMALPTGLALMLLSLGTLAGNGRAAFPLDALCGSNTRALLLRSFLPVAPIVVISDSLFYRLLPIQNPALHAAVLVIFSTTVILATIIQTSRSIAKKMDRLDLLRNTAEESLRRHAHALEQQAGLLDLAHSAIIVRDFKHIVHFWNRGAEDIFGFSREYALGRSIVELLKPELPAHVADIEEELRATGSWKGEATYRDQHGRTRVMDSRWSLHKDAATGEPRGVLEVNNDVTDRRQAETDLRVQLRLNTLLNQIATSISERHDLESILNVLLHKLEESLPLDFALVCVFSPQTDRTALVVTGPRARWLSEPLRHPFADEAALGALVSEECLRGAPAYWGDTRQEDSPLAAMYGQAGFCSMAVVPLIASSQVRGVLLGARNAAQAINEAERAFLRQVGEHVGLAVQDAHLYEELMRSNEELRRTQEAVLQQERLRALGQMASGIAHDINNALSPIVGYADLLLCTETELSEESRKHLETIMTAAGDISEIISRLRQFYRPPEEVGRMSPAALNSLIEQAVTLTRPRWKDACEEAGIQILIEKHLAPESPEILCVESEIREALINLIINALDAMPHGGTLQLRSFQKHDRAYIEVQDTGVGMDEETLRRCFEPFYTTKGDRGTGLGLGMVYGIVQRHQGDLGVESTPGKGSTMRLSFPVRKSHKEEAETSVHYGHMKHLRILVVDDEPLLRNVVFELLQKDEHDVELAENGQVSLLKFEAALETGAPFDLVITDLGMPDVGGRRVAQAVKRLAPDVPVILLTGWGTRMRAEGEIPPEVDDVLSKPPRLESLRDAIAGVMNKKYYGG